MSLCGADPTRSCTCQPDEGQLCPVAESLRAQVAAAEAADAVHGPCAVWLRQFYRTHGRDPFPQEVWDAAITTKGQP